MIFSLLSDKWYVRSDYVFNVYHDTQTDLLYCSNCASMVGKHIGDRVYFLENIRSILVRSMIFPTDLGTYVVMENSSIFSETTINYSDSPGNIEYHTVSVNASNGQRDAYALDSENDMLNNNNQKILD